MLQKTVKSTKYVMLQGKSTIQIKKFRHVLSTFIIGMLLCSRAFSATYDIKKDSDIVGMIAYYRVGAEDTLYSIAQKFDLGIVELMAANPGVDPWIPRKNSIITIPSAYILPHGKRSGVVINLPELRMFFFKDAKTVMTFPVGIGREGWQTPIGDTTIILKRKDPVWIPPASILAENPDLPKIIPAGPDNPMGQYALSLGWQSFAIHGTNKPYGIGLRSSHGCIRMYPEDIEELFQLVRKGTKVTVIDNPYKLGWRNNVLYLEATPTQEQLDAIADRKKPETIIPSEIYSQIEKIMTDNGGVDWHIVDEAIITRSGVPVAIGSREGE